MQLIRLQLQERIPAIAHTLDANACTAWPDGVAWGRSSRDGCGRERGKQAALCACGEEALGETSTSSEGWEHTRNSGITQTIATQWPANGRQYLRRQWASMQQQFRLEGRPCRTRFRKHTGATHGNSLQLEQHGSAPLRQSCKNSCLEDAIFSLATLLRWSLFPREASLSHPPMFHPVID